MAQNTRCSGLIFYTLIEYIIINNYDFFTYLNVKYVIYKNKK
jgi:hypothetical protein